MTKRVLRYGPQDIELSLGRFVIGRAASCQLSLDDPLVSRHHAELVVESDSVSVQDLGSRNGVRVNGEAVVKRFAVRHNDEITIGSQSLTYLVRAGDPAVTLIQPPTQPSSTFGLLGILADKAFALGRADEAERLLGELLEQVLSDLEAGRDVKPAAFDGATHYALKLAAGTSNGRWVDYLFRSFAAIRKPCTAAIVDELYTAVRRIERISLPLLRGYIDILHENTGSLGPSERFLLSRLEGLERLIAAR